MAGIKTLRYRVEKIERHFGLRNFSVNTVSRKARSDVYYTVLLVPYNGFPQGVLDASKIQMEVEEPLEIDQVISFEGGF